MLASPVRLAGAFWLLGACWFVSAAAVVPPGRGRAAVRRRSFGASLVGAPLSVLVGAPLSGLVGSPPAAGAAGAERAGSIPQIGPASRAASGAEPPTIKTESGLQYQDFKPGTGATPALGQRVTVDYVMSTTGARYGSRIESTKDNDRPFSFVLGDVGVIAGLSEAVASMKAGGVRRAYIPARLGYTDYGASLQPQPTDFADLQRWKNIYANINRPYQPELILDIKLFGK